MTLFDAAASQAARDEAIQRVSDNTEAGWRSRARRTLVEVARSLPELTTDDLIRAGLEKPREPRAFGPVMRWGARGGVIAGTGRVRKSEQVSNHSRPMAVWRSLLYGGS